jgi:LemA protein
MPIFTIFGLFAVVVIAYAISVFNFLSSARTRIQAAIQEIGNQLKRQVELIPNLETSAKTYLKHEKDIFKLLTDARKSVQDAVKSMDPAQYSRAGDKVSELLSKIQVIVESNPQLKGSDVISRLMDELRDTSDKVMYSRRTLIDLTADYNIKLVTFPSNLVANLFGFKPEAGLSTPASGSHLTVSESELTPPKISL